MTECAQFQPFRQFGIELSFLLWFNLTITIISKLLDPMVKLASQLAGSQDTIEEKN